MFACLRAAALSLLLVLGLAACQRDTPVADARVADAGETADPSAAVVTVSDAWVRATPPGAAVAGGYFTLTNNSTQPLRLVAVETPAAPGVEIHEMRSVDGVMQMRELSEGVVLDPGQPVTLAPGGIHLMLMAPPTALAAGDEVTLRLVFEGADAIEVQAPVRTGAPTSGDAAHH